MPTLPLSLSKGIKKSPNFNVAKQSNAAGKGISAISFKPYPTWDFEFSLDRVTGNEEASSVVTQMLGTYISCQGSASLFLFTDPQDSNVNYANGRMLDVTPATSTPMQTTGNGSDTQFQLCRTIGGAYDILQNVNVTGLEVNGVSMTLGTDYSVNSTGIVTFTTAPANTYSLTWQGTFQYLCRFAKDTINATRVFTTNSGTDQWDFESIMFSSEFI